MEITPTFLLVLGACYLIGSIPCGLIVTRLAGYEDIRKKGSGNIGATNVYRTASKKLGIATLALDALKGGGPLYLTMHYLPFSEIHYAVIITALFLGHCYSIFLGFKGGKGVATALGLYLVLAPLAVIEALILFIFIVWKSRYISMGSVSAASIIPFLIYYQLHSWPYFTASAFISLIVVIRHHENIERIVHGTESKFKP
jgi:acyl phosphate:glycerol-3-phosphate acyltransferase